MGQREPWRAQFVIWSRVVKAYCMTPFLGSWLGSKTSRLFERSMEDASRGARDVGVDSGRVEMDVAGRILVADRSARERVVDNIVV